MSETDMAPPLPASGTDPRTGLARTAAALVAGAVLCAFLPAIDGEFVFDDERNFVHNQAYRGLGPQNLAWMFTTFHGGHYQPLTWVTLGLDYVLWGMDPRGYKLTNVVLHAVNAGLFVLLALRLFAAAGLTRRAPGWLVVAMAAAAALLFGLHPLRVESVVWVTERRDLLSALFFLLALLTYVRLQTHPRACRACGAIGGGVWRCAQCGDSLGIPRDLVVLVALFVAGCLSKVSVVMLPPVLLLLDFYPLRRVAGLRELWGRRRDVLLEKLPLFALSLAFGATAALGQAANGWLVPLSLLPLDGRIAVSLYGLTWYIGKTLLPTRLLPIYELHNPVNPLETRFLVAAAIVLAVAISLWVMRRRWPALATAAAAYAVILLPVIGLSQNGPQMVADRYSYLSCMGWPIVLAGWALHRLGPLPHIRWAVAGCASAALLSTACGAATVVQSRRWHDSETLWSYTVQHAPDSSLALGNLGVALMRRGHQARLQGNLEQARQEYQRALHFLGRAIDIRPRNETAWIHCWDALRLLGRTQDLALAYQAALSIRFLVPQAHVGLAELARDAGDHDAAIDHLRTALAELPEHDRYAPDRYRAHLLMGQILNDRGDLARAADHLSRALACDPLATEPRLHLAAVLIRAGRPQEARQLLDEALRIDPHSRAARALLDRLEHGSEPGLAPQVPATQPPGP